MSKYLSEKILTVHHWTDNLFSFTATRDPSFRFRNGEFTMIGLEVDGKPLVRAYSMASANYEEHLEFLSIKVQSGPLTSRLQHVQPGDTLLVSQKPVGTLVADALLPGKTLWMLSTGTGLAPFMSIIKDPEVYERFERMVLVHGCRRVAELAYRDFIKHELPENEYFGEVVRQKLVYYPTVTREPFDTQGRITELLDSSKLTQDLGLEDLSHEHDRVMICGSPSMLKDLTDRLKERGFEEGRENKPAHYVIERAFVER
ncbi:MAG: ferredoxin--NADP reductase [Betaproteobacteria bacterium]|nr:ferredoxin--NADP reductase [Betaproteobacteria bacterium]